MRQSTGDFRGRRRLEAGFLGLVLVVTAGRIGAHEFHAGELDGSHYGPYRARVVEVLDGYRLVVDLAVLPGRVEQVTLELEGIAPPPRLSPAHAACGAEARERARWYTEDWLFGAAEILVTGLHGEGPDGPLHGQLLRDGADLGEELIRAGLAVPGSEAGDPGGCDE